MSKSSHHTFRISPVRPWLLAVSVLSILAAFGMVISAVQGAFGSVTVILIVLAVAAVGLLLPIGLAVGISRWHVDQHGVGGRNNYLVYNRLDWSEIESVEPWLIPGYRYLQVNGVRQRWVFWLPLFLTDMPGFREAVSKYAPLENPLRHYLEQYPT
jgi:hypothetical protein